METELLSIVGDIYDCAIEPNRWPQAMERIAVTLGGKGASVTMQDPMQREIRVHAHWGFEAKFYSAMLDAAPINPLMSASWFQDLDEPYTGIGYIGRDDYYQTQFYREIIGRFGYCDAAITNLVKTTNRFGALVVGTRTSRASGRMSNSIGSA